MLSSFPNSFPLPQSLGRRFQLLSVRPRDLLWVERCEPRERKKDRKKENGREGGGGQSVREARDGTLREDRAWQTARATERLQTLPAE